jgi:filamentous hemagglutinin family protein
MKIDEKDGRVRIYNRQGRQFSRRILPALIASCFACGPVFANPTGAQVVSGQVNISSNGNTLTITNTPGSIINWLSFSIGAGQVTQFLQQNASSSVLNRIISQNPSQIFGTLESNGRVFLINPNGILFEPGSQINVGGLVASSLDITNTDFISGKNNFTSTVAAPGAVVNQGTITTPSGGSIYLIAPQVQNTGVMTSPQGEILLAAGHSVDLVDGGDPNIQVVISSGADQALNLGQVIAEGGKIGIYGALVNQGGTVSADSAVVGQNGEIVFKSSQTTTLGANSVSSAVGKGGGGTVEVLGPNVEIIDNALVNASGQTGGGKVMVGGDFHGTNAAIPDSASVFIGADSVIKADAIQSGNGGKVAVWSDNGTLFYGSISAQGGAQGGNGGYVETSSKNYLNFDGNVNLLASKGSTGSLLLDPYTITITDSGATPQITATGTSPYVYASNSVSYISTATLNSELNAANVNVNTTGSITVNSGTAVTWPYYTTLTLAAGSDIFINSPITTSTGTLVMTSAAGNITQNNTNGTINVYELSAVATTGNVVLNNSGNSTDYISGSAGGTSGFQFTNGSSNTLQITTIGTVAGISTTGGNIQLQSTGGIYVGRPLTASNGSIGLNSGGQIGIYQAMTASGTIALQATGRIYQTNGDPPTITAANLSAVSSTGYVGLSLDLNHITGNVAGRAGGNNGEGGTGFQFANNTGFSVGAVPAVGNIPAISGITSTNGSINLYTSTGNITLAGQVNAGTSSIYVGSNGGSILQSGTSNITTSGELSLFATGSIGTSGAGNSLLTNVNSLYISGATDVYISNAATGTLTLEESLGSGVLNLSTAGALTLPSGECEGPCTLVTGSAITLVSGGNMSFGDNIAINANLATEPISLYAGFTETPGSTPVSNLTFSTLTQGNVSFNGAPINLWANQYADFLGVGTATFSNPAQVFYHPSSATPIDITVTGATVTDRYYDGTVIASFTGGTLSGISSEYLSGVTLSQSGVFATKNAGTGIEVTSTDTLTIAPALAGDFVFVQPTGFTGTINPAILTVTGQVANNKIYDGTTSATLTGGTLAGVVSGESALVALTQSGYFAVSTVGNNIQVIATDSISGTGASNYTLVQPTGLVANIIGGSGVNQVPNVLVATQNYIVGLNTSIGTALTGDGTPSGSSGSGYSNTSNTGTINNENSNKLYCN